MYNAGRYVYGEILPIKHIYGTLDNDKKEKVIFKSYLQINCDLVGTSVIVTNGLRTYKGSIDSSGYCIIEIEKSGNYFIIGKYEKYESIPAKMAIVQNNHLYEFDLEIELPEPEPDMDYLKFASGSEFTLATVNNTINWDGILEYSFDKVTWSVWDGTELTSSTGNVIYLRGSNNTVITGSISESRGFVLTGGNINCSGNIETILDYKTVLIEEHPVMGANCYCNLFKNCTSLVTAPLLPATTLTDFCYRNMFNGCVSLTEAPELPATILSTACYQYMFDGCTLLTSPPELPATTLAENCYEGMFHSCGLTSAPELPATTLADYCYAIMFWNCSSLETAPELPAEVMSSRCYSSMFSGCTSLTTPPALPAKTLADGCYYGMFSSCTSLTTPSALPATTLEERCYPNMFTGCTSIKLSATQTSEYTTPYRIPSEGTGVDATNALKDMFGSTGGTFTGTPQINTTYYLWNPVDTNFLTFSSESPFTLGVINDGSTLHPSWDGTLEYSTDKNIWTVWDGLSAISSDTDNKIYLRGAGNTAFTVYDPYQWIITGNTNFELSGTSTVRCFGNIETLLDYKTVGLGNHPSMNSYCYYGLFKNCVLLTEAPEFPATVLTPICYSHMFSGCISLTAVPELPATTLAGSCYDSMFQGCTSLTTAPIQISALKSATNCCREMFKNCTSLTDAPLLSATSVDDFCYQEMFAGCTSLTTPPELPAATVGVGAYSRMFMDCTSLSTLPELPATNLERNCYTSMFSGCTSIKVSQTQTSEYTIPYRIPSEGVVPPPGPSYGLDNMFTGTGGTFTGTPEINTTYYLYEPQNPYLTFSSENPFTLGVTHAAWNGTVEYSTDKLNWSAWYGTSALSSNSENELYFRGTSNTSFYNTSSNQATTFVLTSPTNSGIRCDGNIETLLDYQTVANDQHPQMDPSCFWMLFSQCTSLTSTPELPATTLAASCYSWMFDGCTSLTTPPALPATALVRNCYAHMFSGCTSLTTPPALPATTLTLGCYSSMFLGCTSLTTPPALPATTLASNCYEGMFAGCTSLTTTPALLATTLVVRCYSSMFTGCTSLTTAPVLPATTLVGSCYSAMFDGCTSLTTPPALPATTLADYCYQQMFTNCTSLTTPPALPAKTLAASCYLQMFSGCTSIKLSATQTSEYTVPYRIPSKGKGVTGTNALTNMFAETGGTFKGTPQINTPYYLYSP